MQKVWRHPRALSTARCEGEAVAVMSFETTRFQSDCLGDDPTKTFLDLLALMLSGSRTIDVRRCFSLQDAIDRCFIF